MPVLRVTHQRSCALRPLQAVRQKNFKRVRTVIEDSLFLAKPTFLPSLMDIGAAVAEVRTMPFVSANPSHLYTLPEYTELQVGRAH